MKENSEKWRNWKAEEKKTIKSMRKFDETIVEPDDAGKN
jgi:hypothetical protein